MKTLRNKQIDWSQFQKAREDMRLTLAAVEEMTGVAWGTISHLEKGHHVVLGDSALKLLFFYELTEDDVLVDAVEDKKES